MSRSSVASLTGGLLVAKGTAGPSYFALGEEGGGAGPATLPAGVVPIARAKPRTGGGVSRLTLRIDAARHRRLRIAAAQFGKSGHALLVAALDHYLEQVVPGLVPGACNCLDGAIVGKDGVALLAPQGP